MSLVTGMAPGRRLFSPEGEAALAATMARRPLLAFDFDGTLAPIVARPEDARVPPALATRLQRLSAQLLVAVISGRRAHDLRHRLGFSPWRVVGNHGAEDEAAGVAQHVVQALDDARARLAAHATALREAGVSIEDKHASIAVHYRLARDRQQAARVIAEALDGLSPALRVFGGKLVTNIASVQAHDKAHALADLVALAGVDAAVFVGDDVNDEPVFARAEPAWLTVRVGRDDPSSQARYLLDSLADLPGLLDRMLAALPSPPP